MNKRAQLSPPGYRRRYDTLAFHAFKTGRQPSDYGITSDSRSYVGLGAFRQEPLRLIRIDGHAGAVGPIARGVVARIVTDPHDAD